MADTAVKLTEKQHTVLSILVRRKMDIDGALSCAEIGEIVFRHQRVRHGAREWAAGPLKQLQAKGLADVLGTTGTARTWAPTDKGRALLDALKDEGGDHDRLGER